MSLKCLYSLVFWNAIQMLNCIKQQLRSLLIENSILKEGRGSRNMYEIVSVRFFFHWNQKRADSDFSSFWQEKGFLQVDWKFLKQYK